MPDGFQEAFEPGVTPYARRQSRATMCRAFYLECWSELTCVSATVPHVESLTARAL